MDSCLVCGTSGAEAHFGGMSCRACAAFFRRYFHSTKSLISCTCKTRNQNSHPCRECRIRKCLAAGMKQNKVQNQRAKHSQDEKLELLRESTSKSPPNSLSHLPLSLAHTHLSPKDTKNITFTVPKFSNYETKRFEVFSTLESQNVYHQSVYAPCRGLNLLASAYCILQSNF